MPDRIIVLFTDEEQKGRFLVEYGVWLLAYETATYVHLSLNSPLFHTDEKRKEFVKSILDRGYEVALLYHE